MHFLRGPDRGARDLLVNPAELRFQSVIVQLEGPATSSWRYELPSRSARSSSRPSSQPEPLRTRHQPQMRRA